MTRSPAPAPEKIGALAFTEAGSGSPLLLLHGATSSGRVWGPLIPTLARTRRVIALDLPGQGDSPSTAQTPPQWAVEVADLLDRRELERVQVVGHSSGGWTALELAKRGRAASVLALAPAGLRCSRVVREMALRSTSARPGALDPDEAIANARAAIATDSFPRHFRETRVLRFIGGQGIEVPVRIVWGGRDRIAFGPKSRFTDELPPQIEVETWPDCGHMLMWDAPERILAAIAELEPARSPPT